MQILRLDQLIAAAVFVGARVAGLMVFFPFLGSDAIPARVKVVLVLLITALLYPLRGPLQLDLSSWQWVGIALGEAIIGLLMGLAANLLIEGAMLAGQILGVQMGYSLASIFDPQTQADTPVLGEFHRLAALFIFLQLDVHHWLLRAIVRSFVYLPAGTTIVGYKAGAVLLHGVGAIFLAGVQIAAPGLVATLATDVALGFLGKASPQFPVLFVGLAVKNLAGLAVLIAVIAYWPQSFSQRFTDSITLGERLLHLTQ